MPRTPGGKGNEHRDGAVVLTPARGAGSASRRGGSASSKGRGRDSAYFESARESAPVTPNSKSRGAEQQDSENGRGSSWGRDDNKGGSSWGHGKGDSHGKGQAKGKGKGAPKVASETAPAAEAKATAPQAPRVRDEIQEEVDAIVSKNSNLQRADFDGRVFQYLHAIHGVGGRDRVRKALETIHLSTLQKQRGSVKKWPAYLATLLKKAFDGLGAEKKEEKDRARLEAESYGKQLSLSVDALFEKPVELSSAAAVPGGPNDATPRGSGNPAANPQEAGSPAPEWNRQVVTEEREQQWLKRGSNLLLSTLTDPATPLGMPESPLAIRTIPPGFTPPQLASPAHAHGSMFANYPLSPQHSGQGMLSPPSRSAFASTPPPLLHSSPPPFSPPPPPQLPSQPPPAPPAAFHTQDPYKQQQQPAAPPPPSQPPAQLQDLYRPAAAPPSQPPAQLHNPYRHPPGAPPPPSQPPTVNQQQQGPPGQPPRVISPPAVPAPNNSQQQQQHQPRVVPPPQRRRQQPQVTPMSPNAAATAARPPPPPSAPPTDAAGVQLLPPDASWTMKSTPLLPPPWPAQYVQAA